MIREYCDRRKVWYVVGVTLDADANGGRISIELAPRRPIFSPMLRSRMTMTAEDAHEAGGILASGLGFVPEGGW